MDIFYFIDIDQIFHIQSCAIFYLNESTLFNGELKMHDGCQGHFQSGKDVVDKIRMMGFNIILLGTPLDINCTNCEKDFKMERMEASCPHCGMVYGVTPCHSNSAEFVQAAGINY